MTTQSSQSDTRRGFLSLLVLRDIAVIALLIVITWKLVNADISVDLASFSFTDFLALVLALFSVGLSTAFYFKANEASNKFYDNTYKFTKDMSEILGRIEAGFGERLKHLDEGYSGVRDRLDKLPYSASATHSEVKEEEEEISRKEREQKALIEELAGRASLAEHEKQTLFATLEQNRRELDSARAQLHKMQEGRARTGESEPNRRVLLRYLARQLRSVLPPEISDESLTIGQVAKAFTDKKSELAEAALADMVKVGFLDDHGKLTAAAKVLLRQHLLLEAPGHQG